MEIKTMSVVRTSVSCQCHYVDRVFTVKYGSIQAEAGRFGFDST